MDFNRHVRRVYRPSRFVGCPTLVDSAFMAEIRPFHGLRYSANEGNLDALVAPPYDVLSPNQRDEYAARNPHNVVHLTLPESQPDDRSKYVKYARSAAKLAEWRRDGALAPEAKPALYRYTQTFGDLGDGKVYVRTSIIALIKVEPYSKGVVLPHEQTFPKHKEDRLRILEATRSHLECIFGLYEDPNSGILNTVRTAPAGSAVEAKTDDGVHHLLEPIVDEDTLAVLVGMMADRKVWIADGHHRYETALAFRESIGERDETVAEDFMMMALSSISDEGLVLLPTHRMVSKLPHSKEKVLETLSQYFDVAETHSSRLVASIEAAKAEGQRAFALTLQGGVAYVLTSKDDEALISLVEGEASDALKSLDVTILHSVIFEKLLGIHGLDLISYTRDASEAIMATETNSTAASFIMNPPSVDDMKEIALGGEKMPQKSTYYFPKILSGLVLWSLNDF